MATERLTNFTDFVAYLEENKVPHRSDANALAVQLPIAESAGAGAVLVRWERDLPYVQVIYPFITDVPTARILAIESALCRVNTTIRLPGFGLEYDSRAIYMRLCVQLYDGGIPALACEQQIRAVLQNARESGAAFREVVAGAPAENVVDIAIKHAQAAAAGATS